MKKRVLITGQSSYVAKSFEQYSKRSAAEGRTQLEGTLLSVRDNIWKKESFAQYDAILHCAGIVHQKKSVTEEEYERVNCMLTVELAQKAYKEGVPQFIFMSTMNVYGLQTGVITSETVPAPKSPYGKSKLMAEKELLRLQTEQFKVCILRPPMIYGKGCKGNYQLLSRLAALTPVFPDIRNGRSMLCIENLCELLRLLIENEEAGIYFPQDKEYVETAEMVQQIASAHGRRVRLTPVFNPLIRLACGISVIQKVFGSLQYEKQLSVYDKGEYQKMGLKEAIAESEST